MPIKKTKTEKAKNIMAFEVYYSMGDKRKLNDLAEMLGMSLSSIQHWSRSFKWADKIKQRDAGLANYFEKKNHKIQQAMRKRFLSTIEAVLNKSVSYHEDGILVKSTGIKAINPADLEKLIKAHALLTGEATERQDLKVPKDTKFIVEFV